MVEMSNTGHLFLILGIVFNSVFPINAIGCFVCNSINKSNPACEDTFNNTDPTIYQSQCQTSRKDRQGLFPASACVKFKGTVVSTGVTYVVRTCVVENGDINTDTEIARSDHCSGSNLVLFDLNGVEEWVSGCVSSCLIDGCNKGAALHNPQLSVLAAAVISLKVLNLI